MFEPSSEPRIFACAPGVDFPRALVAGILRRMADRPPEALARVELFVNTRRMQRRIAALFDDGQARFLPRIRVITDLAHLPVVPEIPKPVSPLRRRLELSRLVARLLDKEPDLAPRSALYDLADSLAKLFEEMHDEDVPPQALDRLDVADQSGHWQRSRKFIAIAQRYFDTQSGEAPDPTARLRRVVDRLASQWACEPPQKTVIVAGSTGSRGSTARFMQAVAALPRGAVVLPGFEFDLPARVWATMDDARISEDHPQFRFHRLLTRCGADPEQVRPWEPAAEVPNPARNRLVSLALRPAPVTSQWMIEGPGLTDLADATRSMTLIEAQSGRQEAAAIALILREAAQTGKTAALVTPDRLLIRRVTAALDRWRIEPDSSAGDALDLSPPGRLLRHVAEMFTHRMSGERLLVLLKHPLAAAGEGGRAAHLSLVRELELSLRRHGPLYPCANDLLSFARSDRDSEKCDRRLSWAQWVGDTLFGHEHAPMLSLAAHLKRTLDTAEALVRGPTGDSGEMLWQAAAGEAARALIDDLRAEAHHGGELSPAEFAPLLHSILRAQDVRDPVRPHPGIMIWGTLEARVQGAELVILGGLNDGVWPELPAADPWLNRDMRHQVGLLLPERRIGLAAHDFQQSVAAREVCLSRAIRDDEAQTVPSRWLNRLTNLLGGLPGQGPQLLADMRARGDRWLGLAQRLETPERSDPQPRPSPSPPLGTRPRRLPVTAITRLVRDPYAIYAQHVLGLRRLDPLTPRPDAPMRGTIVHAIMEAFLESVDLSRGPQEARACLLATAQRILEEMAPWPTARILWRAGLERIADDFLEGEMRRRELGRPVLTEERATFRFEEIDFTLTAQPDRIDQAPDGSFLVYDYKTGHVPTPREMAYFEKQLPLQALLIECGAFARLGRGRVSAYAHIGLGANTAWTPVAVAPGDMAVLRDEFFRLISAYDTRARGYTSRRAVASVRHAGDYDHLARHGEWDDADEPVVTQVGR